MNPRPLLFVLFSWFACGPAAGLDVVSPAKLERSFWLHASLAADTRRGYWGPGFPEAVAASEAEIRNAARLLSGAYAANRLYLIYHLELPPEEAMTRFRAWREACPPEVELVPTFVLRNYAKESADVFTVDEVRQLASFFRQVVNPRRTAIYDVYGGRGQGAGLAVLTNEFPGGVLRVGIQPDEPLGPPFAGAVADTWSAFCHGRTHDNWRKDAAGAPSLRRWVEVRNAGAVPVAWDLIAVAWDYAANARGAHPGYDDAARNMPLPAGRNALAAAEILGAARPMSLAGFSSDLFILHENSRNPARDGPRGALYETLKRGEDYRGHFAAPFGEIVRIFSDLRAGRLSTVRDRDDMR